MPSFYDVLDVDDDATPEEIREAYLLLAKEYHPDHNKSPGADTVFLEIVQAYDVLSDRSRRRLYDTEGLLPKSVGELICQNSAGRRILYQMLPSAPMARRRGIDCVVVCPVLEYFLQVGGQFTFEVSQGEGLEPKIHNLQIPPIAEKVPWTIIEKAGPPGTNGGSRGKLRVLLITSDTKKESE
jgi:curved DNA-binding protein CbpA